jgi:hypothetical protein
MLLPLLCIKNMKKLLLLSTIAFSLNALAQAVPGGNFETWSNIAYNNPGGWSTGNLRDVYQMGAATITKVNGNSGFAMRLQTNIVNGDTSESYAINTTDPCGDPPTWKGGVTYTQQPTGISGYYRYSLPGADTALLIVIFRKNGVHVGDNIIKIRGTGSQLTWTSFSHTLSCGQVPDSVIIAAASSNKVNNVGIQNGSFLELDGLAFVGASQPIPNGDFESWTAQSKDDPAGWMSEPGVSQSTVAYTGTYALRMETGNDPCGGTKGAQITSGITSKNSPPRGGHPYTGTIDTLCGYFKYIPQGVDSAIITVSLTKNGSMAGGASKKLLASGNYVYFSLPFSAGMTPDTLRIDIQSSRNQASPSNSGSVLYIDNLSLKSQPLGFRQTELENSDVTLYPNPASDKIQIDIHDRSRISKTVLLYNSTGKLLDKWLTEDGLCIDVKSLAPDLYFIQVSSGNNVTIKRFAKE